jgi:hypothetical protein
MVRFLARPTTALIRRHQECIPPQYRAVGGIARFVEPLLLPLGNRRRRRRGATFPHSMCYPPSPLPRRVLRVWPWRRVPAIDEHGNASPIIKEAHRYGLRAITKARWDTLNEEYLVYKRSVVDELVRAETDMHRPDQGVPDHERGEPTARPHPHPKTQTQTRTYHSISGFFISILVLSSGIFSFAFSLCMLVLALCNCDQMCHSYI